MYLGVMVEGIGKKNRFLKLGVEGKGRGVGLALLYPPPCLTVPPRIEVKHTTVLFEEDTYQAVRAKLGRDARRGGGGQLGDVVHHVHAVGEFAERYESVPRE